MGKFYSDQNFTKPATNALMNARNGLVSGSVDFLDAPSHDSLQTHKVPVSYRRRISLSADTLKKIRMGIFESQNDKVRRWSLQINSV